MQDSWEIAGLFTGWNGATSWQLPIIGISNASTITMVPGLAVSGYPKSMPAGKERRRRRGAWGGHVLSRAGRHRQHVPAVKAQRGGDTGGWRSCRAVTLSLWRDYSDVPRVINEAK